MTNYEYELLQQNLRKHLKTKHGYRGNKGEVFCEGIRVAMSMLKGFYDYPRMREEKEATKNENC